MDAVAGLRADVALVFPGLGQFIQQVGLVENHEIRDLLFDKKGDQLLIACLSSLLRVHHQHGNVRAVEHLPGLLHPQRAQLALVVEARGVDDHDRPQGQQLHGLAHRVGGGALHLGDHGQGLAGDGVDHAGLARVPAAEKADVYSVPGGGVVQSHGILLTGSQSRSPRPPWGRRWTPPARRSGRCRKCPCNSS